jgi:hypothetical protein
MYELLYAGRFGNYPRAWESLEELQASGFSGEVSLRSKEVSNPVKLYHIPSEKVAEIVAALPEAQRNSGLVFSEAPPDSQRAIQGEWDGTNLTYSFVPKPMRLAFVEDMRHADGLEAKTLLRYYLDPADVEWLDELLEDFPDHVVEFSGFKIRTGTHRRRMIVWEVRQY